ncbi:olfactory receptor 5L2-like [Suricata suricatta]|uniref:olfactory receptor 5L2-like n=1 Tax=Suricata suricatta TaxID=37032 RepID=UPI0011562FC2|nr:olfactory receptor 5L2-like [Suricata suricatta]
MNELLLYIVATINEFTTIVIILTSYLLILITILRMHSAEGRRKAFSTCASHLTAILVFHGTILFIYCRPSFGNSMDTDKVATVFYTVVIPMLNPLIYSLRNKDVKEAVRKMRDRGHDAASKPCNYTSMTLIPKPNKDNTQRKTQT